MIVIDSTNDNIFLGDYGTLKYPNGSYATPQEFVYAVNATKPCNGLVRLSYDDGSGVFHFHFDALEGSVMGFTLGGCKYEFSKLG